MSWSQTDRKRLTEPGRIEKLVRDHHAWSDDLLLEPLAQQTLGSFRVTSALNKNSEHNPVLKLQKSSYFYRSRRLLQAALTKRILEIAATRVRLAIGVFMCCCGGKDGL